MANILDYFPNGWTPSKLQADVLRELQLRWNSAQVFVLKLDVACHGKGQQVLKADGSKIAIEDVQVGDELLGPDGTPRTVTQTHKGTAPLYTVSANRYGSYTVTGNHVWPVLKDCRKMENAKVHCFREQQEHKTEDLAAMPPSTLVTHYLQSAKIEVTEDKDLPLDPYVLGLWLGDGSSDCPHLTTQDEVIANTWISWGQTHGATCRIKAKPDSQAKTYALHTPRGQANPTLQVLQTMQLIKNKHIPEVYFQASTRQRQELLAGLIDTDGHVKSGIEITQVRSSLAADIQRLAQSLGYSATLTVKPIKGKDYYRVYICGPHVEQLNLRLAYKKEALKNSKRDLTNRRFTVTPAGVGEFYGVTVDKDHLYLLDDYTITHNSGKSPVAVCIANWLDAQSKARKSGARICTPTNVLVDQYSKHYPDVSVVKSAGNYACPTRERRCGSFSAAQRCKGCVYTKARDTAKTSSISVSTYHMNLALREKRVAMIFDEAHNIPRVIRDMQSPRIFAHRIGIPREAVGSMRQTVEWVRGLGDWELSKMTKAEAKLLRDFKKDIKAEKPLHFYTWETDFWSNGGELWDEKLVRGEPTEAPVLKQLPIEIGDKTSQFWDSNQKLILMSATIGRPDLYELGLDRTRPVFIEGDPPIDPSRNPIIKDYVGTVSHQNTDALIPKMAERILDLLNNKKGKGVIHVTYSLARKLQPLIAHERLITHTSGNMRAKLKDFIKSDNGVFLVSGMYEGVSLDYNLADWQIVTKVVWPSLEDPLQRYYSKDNPDYYLWSTLKTMVQISGRVCRRPDDYGETYIWDASFERLLSEGQHLTSRHFTDRIVEPTT